MEETIKLCEIEMNDLNTCTIKSVKRGERGMIFLLFIMILIPIMKIVFFRYNSDYDLYIYTFFLLALACNAIHSRGRIIVYLKQQLSRDNK